MKKILIIDDSLFSLRIHSELVEQLGHEAITALGGEKALALFEEQEPDIVLCDIMMPDIDGYEVLQIIKEMNPDICFYFVSAELTDKSRNKAMNLGANGFIEKPLELEVLEKIFTKHLS